MEAKAVRKLQPRRELGEFAVTLRNQSLNNNASKSSMPQSHNHVCRWFAIMVYGSLVNPGPEK